MFVYSVKSQKSKFIAVLLIVLLIVLGFVVCSQLGEADGVGEDEIVTDAEKAEAAVGKELSYDAADASERLGFIAQFVWQVNEEPDTVTEVLIPEDFDEVYESYNNLQLSQGLDLRAYQGKRVKRWSYAVTNYPDTENSADTIRIDLLISGGKVVGGDVCSLAEDGFMHGFAMES